jgi:beta-glucanase (GH16 family)
VPLRGRSTSTAGDPTVTDVDPQTTAPWRLRFDEEFDASALDTDVWDYRQQGEHAPDRGRGHAASSRKAVRVADGVATLSSIVDPEKPGYYLNGHISTEKSYLFRRGIASARVKFQRSRGQHGAFLVQAPGEPYRSRGPAQNGAEIDVAEFYGEGYPHGGLSHFVHFLKGHGNQDWARVGGLLGRSDLTMPEGQTWWNRYHVFSVEWTRDTYVFRIDGKATYRTSRGTSDRDEFLVLSMLNSDWELPDLDRSTLPQSMQVDWVRVWQR